MNRDRILPNNVDLEDLLIRDEPDCSPHPLDIMAMFALYQHLDSP